MIFGLICENLSVTDLIPKSGELELHIAPIDVGASMAIIASGIFGKNPATLSPRVTPRSRREAANFSTSANSW